MRGRRAGSETRRSRVATGAAPAVGRVLSDPPKWYSGALHLHTTHSDGALTPAAVADAARDAGYDFIAITDHNNTTHTREPMPSSPLHIVGEEVTTPGGHATVWGLPEGAWIDFRVSPGNLGPPTRSTAWSTPRTQAGALFAISHPFDNCGGCSWEQTIPEISTRVEIWNGAEGTAGAGDRDVGSAAARRPAGDGGRRQRLAPAAGADRRGRGPRARAAV